ncbi:MAG TPA: pyrimidine 5'-nucleotidase [Stellaceae bacterium]|nr:pyrimidine 5'-nucleotidase [Stellaceae bacterium]
MTGRAMAGGGRPLGEIETWIFDLDNTLYPATSTVYPEVEERMNAFIMAELRLDLDSAVALRKRFFAAHGTTLRGLMNEYGLPPKPFLDYVHELDLSNLERNERLGAAIAALPGRKLIFTNATQRHAERVLAQLGLAAHFGAIHDIEACAYVPKPHPSGYRALLARHTVAAERAAMIEDIASNLAPAAALGMTTIWLTGGPHAEDADKDADHIHHVVEDLAAFLAGIAPPVIPAAE